DNIGVFDRSAPLPGGGTIEQADGTSWMAMFCLDMLTIALELAVEDHVYEELACKFFEHFVYISAAMDRIGDNEDELWDEADGFFYDVLRLPGAATEAAVDGRIDSAVRVRGVRARHPRAPAGLRQARRVVRRGERQPDGQHARRLRAGRRRPPSALAGQRRQAAADPHADARRVRVPERLRHPGPVAPPQGPPVLVH